MRRIPAMLFWITVSYFFMAQTSFAQNGEGGIRIKETKAKTIVYEIKITDLGTETLCRSLDQKLSERMGVIHSSTSLSSGICTVEVTHEITPERLKQVVVGCGFTLAKTFTP